MSDWNTYNISYLDSAGRKKRSTMTGLTILDVKTVLQAMVKIDNNQYFDCKILKVWQHKPSTPKQQLAQKYGFIMGSVKGAHSMFDRVGKFEETSPTHPLYNPKLTRAIALADSQFSKLQRDISDVFKLAGLKIK